MKSLEWSVIKNLSLFVQTHTHTHTKQFERQIFSCFLLPKNFRTTKAAFRI